MSAEWKRAPLPEGHEEEGLLHDGSDGMGRILLAGLAAGGVAATLYFVGASDRWDSRTADRAAHAGYRPEPADVRVTGTVHIPKVEVDVDLGDLGWQHRGAAAGGGFYLAQGGVRTAELAFGSLKRANSWTTDGMITDLALHPTGVGVAHCEASAARAGQAAIYCNNDPQHAWAWAEGDWLVYVVYAYDDPDAQPDFAEIQRIVASVR